MPLPPLLRSSWKPALFTLGLILLAWRFHAVGRAVYHTGAAAQADYLLERMPDARVVVFGSSHAGLVHLDAMQLHGQNLWDTGQDLRETEYKARSILPHVEHLQLALISVSYFSFVFDNAAYVVNGTNPRMELRSNLYAAYPGWRPIPGDFENFVKGKLHTVVTEDHFEKAWPHLLSLELPTEPPTPTRSLRHPHERRKLDRAELLKIARARVQRYRGFIEVMQENVPQLERELVACLERTVGAFHERGVQVVLFTPPYWDDFNQSFPKEWQDSMRKHAHALAQRPGVTYLDFSTDPRFRGKVELFADADHLTWAGARRFSVLLKEALDRAGAATR